MLLVDIWATLMAGLYVLLVDRSAILMVGLIGVVGRNLGYLNGRNGRCRW